jgi:hypothetical protein
MIRLTISMYNFTYSLHGIFFEMDELREIETERCLLIFFNRSVKENKLLKY